MQDPSGKNSIEVSDGHTGKVGSVDLKSPGGRRTATRYDVSIQKHVIHEQLKKDAASATIFADLEYAVVEITTTKYNREGEPIAGSATTESYVFREGSHHQITGTSPKNGWVARHDNGQWQKGHLAYRK